uniref:Ovule protein n=1 Tax=Ascaris lumbricoides TaxID=6252 RepID=A0A0M3HW29_ASCLU
MASMLSIFARKKRLCARNFICDPPPHSRLPTDLILNSQRSSIQCIHPFVKSYCCLLYFSMCFFVSAAIPELPYQCFRPYLCREYQVQHIEQTRHTDIRNFPQPILFSSSLSRTTSPLLCSEYQFGIPPQS